MVEKKREVPSPEPLFELKTVVGIIISILLLMGVAFILIVCSSDKVEAEVIEAPPSKVVVPKKVASPSQVVRVVQKGVETKDVPTISVESIIQPPSMVMRTTLVVTHPELDEDDDGVAPRGFDPGDDNVNLIIALFENTGCTVIVGEPRTFGERTFIYTVGKTKCTIVQVVKTVEEVVPSLPLAAGG